MGLIKLLPIAMIVISSMIILDAKPIELRPLNSQQPADQYQTDQRHSENDPMLALPSGKSSRKIPQEAATEQVQYVRYEAHQPQSQEDAATEQQQQQQSQEGQTEEAHQHGDGVVCTQKHPEYAAPYVYGEPQSVLVKQEQGEARPEYTSEVIYVDQNGQVVGQQQQQQANEPERDRALSSVANSLFQQSGRAATILTEVPVRDMPPNVLEKLKREYGVKVVATRERPGANLVINCDEYSDKESPVCARTKPDYEPATQPAEHQPSHSTNGAEHLIYAAQPYSSLGLAAPQESGYEIQHQPEMQHNLSPAHTVYLSNANEGATLFEVQPEMNSEGQAQMQHQQVGPETHEVAVEAQPEPGQEEHANEEESASGNRAQDYGARTGSSKAPQAEVATEPSAEEDESTQSAQAGEAQTNSYTPAPGSSTTVAYVRQQQQAQEEETYSSPNPTTASDNHESSATDAAQESLEDEKPTHEHKA